MKREGACAPELRSHDADRRDGIEELHRRVLGGDSGATNELAAILLPILRSIVRQSTRESDRARVSRSS